MEVKNQYWSTLKYTKLLQFKTIPALSYGNSNIVIFMKVKKALIYKTALPLLPIG